MTDYFYVMISQLNTEIKIIWTIQSLASQCCHYTLNTFMNVLKSVQNVLQMLFFTFQFLYLGIVTYGVSTAIESGMYNVCRIS